MKSEFETIHKVTIEAKLFLTDGTVLTGFFFIKPDERVIDLFNDERAFIPVSDADGAIQFIRKSIIDRIVPIDEKVIRKRRFVSKRSGV